MRGKEIRGSMLLLLTSIIWGVAFVAQSVGMDYVGPFTFTCVRSFIAAFLLLIYSLIADQIKKNKSQIVMSPEQQSVNRKRLMVGGICCGIFLCGGTCFQQIGIQYTTVGKAGFITAFYIIIVPVLGLFFKKKCGPFVWLGVILALAGLYFLCMTEGFSIQLGDILEFICALLFSVQIMCVDYYGDKVDGIKLSCVQFFTGGVISGILMLLFEEPHLSQIIAAWQPVLYASVLSSCVGYTLQIIGQRDLNPTVASLIMSLESVVSVLAGLVILNQSLSRRELLGCVLMFMAIVLAQLPQSKKAVSA